MSNDFLLFENALNEYNKFNSEENVSRSRARTESYQSQKYDDDDNYEYYENQEDNTLPS